MGIRSARVDHDDVRVLVSVVPLAGHVGPISALVAELVRRGHEVRVYSGARYDQRFTDLGARVVPRSTAQDFDENDVGATFPIGRRGGLWEVVALVRDAFIGTAPGQVEDLGRALEEEPADVLVADSMSFGGVLTGEVRDLPWALLNVLPFNLGFEAQPPGRTRPAPGPLGPTADRIGWLGYRALTSPFNRAYQRARAAVGLPRDTRPYGAVLMSRWLVLATGCPSLDGPRSDLPATVHFVGRLEPAGAGLPDLAGVLPSTRPLIVVTQGTHDIQPSDLIQPALDGLAPLPVEVVATSGLRGRVDVGVPAPANARVVDLVDFRSLLARTAVLVTNGGWGGVLGSLAAGVPLVVAAGRAADKAEIAARVDRSGAGIDLRSRRPRPAAVAAAVRRVLDDPTYRDRARLVADELAALGGVRTAADLLERLAATRAPVLRGHGQRDP